MSLTILLDMDEVLADFVGAACAAWGVEPDEVLRHWPAGRWCMLAPLGAALGYLGAVPAEEFWGRLAGDPAFWYGAAELPWARTLLGRVRGLTDEWYVVTAPSRCPSCVPGKQAWLNRLLGVDWCDRLVPTPHKHLLARPDAILVDDREETVRKFEARGGRGVVFPRHHNSLHARAGDPLGHVLPRLEELSVALTL